jgi:hypothetical protein
MAIHRRPRRPGGHRGIHRQLVRGHKLVRHPRQTRDDHAKGHEARTPHPRRARLDCLTVKTKTVSFSPRSLLSSSHRKGHFVSNALDYNENVLSEKICSVPRFKGTHRPRACVSCVLCVSRVSCVPSHTVRCVRLPFLPELLAARSLRFLLLHPMLPMYYPTTTKTKQQIKKKTIVLFLFFRTYKTQTILPSSLFSFARNSQTFQRCSPTF